MQHKRRSIGFMLTILCTFTLLLAACRTGTSANHHTMSQTTTRLKLRETPGVMETMTPGTMTPGTTTPGTMTPGMTTPGTMTPGTIPGTPTAYVGQIQDENAWIGLSTTGKRMVAFVTDGSQDHKPTFAQWFRSAVTNGTIDAAATAKTGADRLQAMLTNDTVTGTVTFGSGKALAFTANAVPTSDQTAGLYRSEHVVNNQHYIAGWIILPPASTTGTATPSATSTTVPPFIGSATPSATETTTPSETATITPSATETATSTPSATGTLQQGGAILNQQTYNILPVPPLAQEQITTKQVTVPNLATFKLVPCRRNLC